MTLICAFCNEPIEDITYIDGVILAQHHGRIDRMTTLGPLPQGNVIECRAFTFMELLPFTHSP